MSLIGKKVKVVFTESAETSEEPDLENFWATIKEVEGNHVTLIDVFYGYGDIMVCAKNCSRADFLDCLKKGKCRKYWLEDEDVEGGIIPYKTKEMTADDCIINTLNPNFLRFDEVK